MKIFARDCALECDYVMFGCLVLIVFLFLPLIGVLIFGSGFLLTRVGIEVKSEVDVPKFPEFPQDFSISYIEFKRFKRIIILLVDALRYDFVKSVSAEDLPPGESFKPYHNHMKTINQLLKDNPDQAKLFKFIADPPTTTMQRIKGLTTGSLPTFVDQTSNFNSHSITEDTILHQILLHGGRSLFMGDDTWLDLFPDIFSEAYPYPSFNVKDLHTVDSGVIRHLFPAIGNSSSWSLLIGHFLGVDHVGHIYGPDHSTMHDKLIQIDEVIRKLISSFPPDSLLAVMGDHGMTETGDHGGDTVEEISAALFLYSSEAIFSTSYDGMLEKELPEIYSDDAVSQKNIVPSISLLLGLPIPYSNLGRIIPQLFLTDPNTSGNSESILRLSKAYLVNCLQVWRYLKHYSSISNDLPYEDLHNLNMIMHNISGITNTLNRNISLQLIKLCDMFLQRAEELCRSIWARFQVSYIVLGLCVLTFTTLLQVLICYSLTQKLASASIYYNVYLKPILLALILVIILYIILMCLSQEYTTPIGYFIATVSVFIILFLSYFQRKDILYVINYIDTISLLLMVIFVISSLTLFSNSFIIWEDKRVEYILQTFNLIFIYLSLADYYRKNPKIIHIHSICTIIIKVVLLTALVVLARPFHSCRPEQDICQNSYFSLPIVTLLEKSFLCGLLRLFLSAVSIILPLLIELSESRLLTTSKWRFVLFIIPIFVYMHWITILYPNPPVSSTLLYFYHVIAPRMLYIFSIAVVLYAALSLYMRGSRGEKYAGSDYYSLVSVVIWYTGCLLLGDGAVPSFFCLYLYFWMLGRTQLMEFVRNRSPQYLLFIALYWYFISTKWYFAVGHQHTVQSIRYEAAFAGFHGDIQYYLLAGFLIIVNMFAPYIYSGFAFCSLALGQYSKYSGTLAHSDAKCRDKSAFKRLNWSELLLCVRTIILIVLCAQHLQVTVSCSVAFLHRRHLMVWNVFAPRFVYEAITYSVTLCTFAVANIILKFN